MNFMTVVKNTALSGLIERKNQIKTLIQTRYKRLKIAMPHRFLIVCGDYGINNIGCFNMKSWRIPSKYRSMSEKEA